jgi:hypothetical protein
MTDYFDIADDPLGDYELDDTERAERQIAKLWNEYRNTGYWPEKEVKDGLGRSTT